MDTTSNKGWFTDPEGGAGKERIQAVSELELAQWLTAQFQTHPGCAEVSVERVIRLELPDSEGCNWSRTLVLNPAGVPPEDYVHAYAAAVEKGRKRFNLSAPPDEASPANDGEHGGG